MVDSSVWIDYLRSKDTPEIMLLDRLFESDMAQIGDHILLEVLQGFRSDHQFEKSKRLLAALPVRDLGGERMAISAAANYRALRAIGITVRKTIDVLIGSYCIAHEIALLHSDRDFDPMERHLGLQVWRG
jgi:predicted nucleic acid-binding protein